MPKLKTAEKTTLVVTDVVDADKACALLEKLMGELEDRIDDGDMSVREINEAAQAVEKIALLQALLKKGGQ